MSSDLNAQTSSRESFAIHNYSEIAYAEIMSIGDNLYLLQYEVVDKEEDAVCISNPTEF